MLSATLEGSYRSDPASFPHVADLRVERADVLLDHVDYRGDDAAHLEAVVVQNVPLDAQLPSRIVTHGRKDITWLSVGSICCSVFFRLSAIWYCGFTRKPRRRYSSAFSVFTTPR